MPLCILNHSEWFRFGPLPAPQTVSSRNLGRLSFDMAISTANTAYTTPRLASLTPDLAWSHNAQVS